jgi:hypothetical protein
MALALIEDALGDPRNAQALAVASELAYLPQAEGGPAYRDKLGLDARLFSVDHTQAYLAQNDDHVVIAFRGTESPATLDGLKDWLLSDAVNLLTLPAGRMGTDFVAAGVGARFHKGFLMALEEVWDPLFEATSAELKRKDRPLWVTGHSLGGALAVLGAWLLQRKFVAVHQVYTYGGPMVGNAQATQAIDKAFADKIYRYVGGLDPVPKLPTLSLLANDYVHCLKEVSVGQAAQAAAGSSLAFFQEMAGRGVNGLLSGDLIHEFWANVMKRIDAHLMPSYKTGIAALSGGKG